ncbi:MAG TPA: phosphodiester glycosidase family protein [Mycobacterium sp.]|nr:phosphodiester glycosidase family protein [Mycobacterium sp.]
MAVAEEGHELLLTITASHQPDVPGLSRPQEASFLRSLGVSNAVALDDGSSPATVARLRPGGPLQLITQPSDAAGREVANGVGVFDAARGYENAHPHPSCPARGRPRSRWSNEWFSVMTTTTWSDGIASSTVPPGWPGRGKLSGSRVGAIIGRPKA